eukprot:CAMPEP_0173455104 /NCGR_PEP_ID=MMETSP1357-20121228/53666_1 /TAXON_ID=77926 /ORGANISM="Hemiselmis rufescens, Strain PCC563" /LENGTH=90 /DNA_ID=CAMNT_0014422197 /DNA_START=236 /DNA_END=508 /DNA_ORIENTATION=+
MHVLIAQHVSAVPDNVTAGQRSIYVAHDDLVGVCPEEGRCVYVVQNFVTLELKGHPIRTLSHGSGNSLEVAALGSARAVWEGALALSVDF